MFLVVGQGHKWTWHDKRVKVLVEFFSSLWTNMQITLYLAQPCDLCDCFAWKYAKLKSRWAKGRYIVINLHEKLPSPQGFTKSLLDSR